MRIAREGRRLSVDREGVRLRLARTGHRLSLAVVLDKASEVPTDALTTDAGEPLFDDAGAYVVQG